MHLLNDSELLRHRKQNHASWQEVYQTPVTEDTPVTANAAPSIAQAANAALVTQAANAAFQLLLLHWLLMQLRLLQFLLSRLNTRSSFPW
jgi:hypothetical protein